MRRRTAVPLKGMWGFWLAASCIWASSVPWQLKGPTVPWGAPGPELPLGNCHWQLHLQHGVLHQKKRFFTRGQWAWNRLPRAVVMAPSARDQAAFGQWSLRHRVWTSSGPVWSRELDYDPCGFLPQDILWFSDYTVAYCLAAVVFSLLGRLLGALWFKYTSNIFTFLVTATEDKLLNK